MSKFTLQRRSFLKGLVGGVAATVSLPPLEAMFNASGTAYADGTLIHPIAGAFLWTGGMVPALWHPAATGSNFPITPGLKPFDDAGLKDYLTTISGLGLYGYDQVMHFTQPYGLFHGGSPYGSFDQELAGRWKTRPDKTPFDSLQLRVSRHTNGAGSYNDSSWVSFRPDGSQLPAEYDPKALAMRLFNIKGDASQLAPASADVHARKSVLDVVNADLARLQQKVGKTDRQRLDQHAQAIRDLEARLIALPNAAACNGSSNPVPAYIPPVNEVEAMNANGPALYRLLAYALACDLTRVFSITWSAPQSNAIYKDCDITLPYHNGLQHGEIAAPVKEQQIQRYVTLAGSHLASLAKMLKDTPTAGGNLLDQCIILGTSELSTAYTIHDVTNQPIVLLGKGKGGKKMLKGNYHARAANLGTWPNPSCWYSRAILSIMHALEGDTSRGQNNSRGNGAASSVIDEIFV